MSRLVSENDTSFRTQLNLAAELGYRDLATMAPAALMPSNRKAWLYPTYAGATYSRTASTTSDHWVIDLGLSTGGVPMLTDGQHDAVFWLEITRSDSTKIRRRVRTFWTSGSPAHLYASLVHPLRETVTAGVFSLIHRFFYLPENVTTILDGSIFDVKGQLLATFDEGFARMSGDLTGLQWETAGQPTGIVRSEHEQLDAPNLAPAVTLLTQGGYTWGPEPWGVFTYRATYRWGYRSQDEPGESDVFVPQLESSASPDSDEVTVANGLQNVQVTVPNLDWQVGFDHAGTTRQHHSGLWVDLFRARQSASGGSVGTIETPDVYQRIATIPGYQQTWVDDGSVVPDYYSRLPEIAGYYAWRPVRHQDKAYVLNLRCIERPRDLDNDFDAYRVQPEHEALLLSLMLVYVFQYDNQPDRSKAEADKALAMLKRFQASQGNPAQLLIPRGWGGSQRRTLADVMANRTYTG